MALAAAISHLQLALGNLEHVLHLVSSVLREAVMRSYANRDSMGKERALAKSLK